MLFPATGFADDQERATAVFAGGCFWCVEEAFDAVDGVVATTSGFAGGHVENPSYEQVVGGGTGHYESVLVEYDPSQVSYEELLYAFWRNVDPLDGGGQFCDRGDPYRAAIFAGSEDEYRAARASKEELEQSGRFEEPIATEILERSTFYPAEEYHQNYYQKNPLRYRFYVTNCRRYARLDQVWGDEARPGKN
ncbi:MAG: peptide-methionine (S)-S-oxide reductase MsrA [Ectothiorhodospiraceae bacterium]|nr:peptide-methionine (S)-S-oxide reductase MsrA [Ectothiorhodospiraceae bacterium]